MKNTITEMKGCSFLVGGKTIHIEDIQHKAEDQYLIFTPEGEEDLVASEDELIHDFEPIVSVVQLQNKAQLFTSVMAQTESMNDLASVLMETISKVKEDPSFVPQANAINNASKQLIEMKKAQIQMFKLGRDLA